MVEPRKKSRLASLWVIIYADFITSLTLFFILLFYTALVGVQKNLSHSEMKDFNEKISKATYNKQKNIEKLMMEEAKKILSTPVMNGKKISDFVEVSVNDKEIILTLKDIVLFDEGRAKIKDEAKPILNAIGSIVKELNEKVIIAGHTFDKINQTMPAGAPRWSIALSRSTGLGPYTSNWELSGARAIQVINYFTSEKLIAPDKMIARACGPSEPIVSNDTIENRIKNRRIEIRIQKHELERKKKII